MSNPIYQAAFDKAVKGVLAQGCASVNKHGDSAYSGPIGAHSPIGYILSECKPCIENKKPFHYAEFYSKDLDEQLTLLGFTTADRYFLWGLQYCHDMGLGRSNDNFIEEFKSDCKELARKYKLTYAY